MLSDVQNALELLRASGTDTAGVEAKAANGGWPKSALSSLSAFANTMGGLLLLGVDEATDFAVVEIDAQLLADTLAAACREQIEPPLTAQVEIVTVEGGHVVAARIDEIPQDRKPAYVKNQGMNRGSYTRVHDGDRQLSTHEVSLLLANRSQPRHDEEPVAGSSVSDFDPDIVRGYLNRLRTNKPSTFARLDDQQALLLVGALVEQPDGDTVASLGGLLAFGQYPQRWFPQLNLVVVAYPTSDHKPLSDGTRFLDNVSVDGPIPRMVEDGIAAIRRNLSRRTRVQSLLREDEWDYPVEVIRELVVNALMHRDLSPAARGTQVRVEIYPDRFVVTNPGGLFGPVSPADLGVVTVTSSRNARLGKLLEDTPLGGGDPVAENRGSGFVTLTRRLDAIGMSRPTVRARVADFAVTLKSASLLDDVALDVLDGLDTDGWTDLDRLVVAVASREGDVTNERMREVSGEHPADVGASFVRLADLGVLERQGSGRGSRWHLVEDVRARVDTRGEHGEPAAGAEFAPQAVEVLRALAAGPISASELAALVAIGSKRNVLLWLNRLEDRGLVEPTALRRRSPANRWRLTDVGFAAIDRIENTEAEGAE